MEPPPEENKISDALPIRYSLGTKPTPPNCLSNLLSKELSLLSPSKKIVPCGIKDKGITNLVKIKKKDYSKLGDLLIEKFILNLRN